MRNIKGNALDLKNWKLYRKNNKRLKIESNRFDPTRGKLEANPTIISSRIKEEKLANHLGRRVE